MDPEPYDVLRRRAVQLPAALHLARCRAQSAAVLNVAEDHLDWYASTGRTYAADKGRIYERVQRACVYNVADPVTERLVRDADVRRGRPRDRVHARHARASAWSAWSRTCWPTGPSSRSASTSAAELCTVADLASPAPHFVANALAAAALARSHGVPTAAVRDGLRVVPARRPPDRRRRPRSTGSRYVDDSKATNPHAAHVVAAGLRPGGVGRRRAGQGRRVRRPRRRACATGCAASCCSAATAR